MNRITLASGARHKREAREAFRDGAERGGRARAAVLDKVIQRGLEAIEATSREVRRK
jgi:hypothetical protein